MWERCAAAGPTSAASATSASARRRGRNVLVIETPHGSSAGDTRGPRGEVHRMVGCMTCARVTPVTRCGRAAGSTGLGACVANGQGQNRTADTRIFSPLLYQLSYLAGCCRTTTSLVAPLAVEGVFAVRS